MVATSITPTVCRSSLARCRERGMRELLLWIVTRAALAYHALGRNIVAHRTALSQRAGTLGRQWGTRRSHQILLCSQGLRRRK